MSVDDGLLRQDPAAPFGVRLDPDRVERAFTDAFQPGSVVLVEGSDLVHADIQARFASDEQAVEVPPARSRTPTTSSGDCSTTSSRVTSSWSSARRRRQNATRSASPPYRPQLRPDLLPLHHHAARRLVNLTSVAPTILTYWLDRANSMEGRRMETGDTGGTLADRTESLVNANEDRTLPRRPRRPDDQRGDGHRDPPRGGRDRARPMDAVAGVRWAIGLLVFAALWLLGFLDATYLAGPFHFERNGGMSTRSGSSS